MARGSFVAVALLAALPCFGQFPGENERLMAAARLWVTVEYFHPYLAYRDIDWNQALVTALPKIRSASNDAEYRAAISGMLEELHDPETYVLPDVKESGPVMAEGPLNNEVIDGSPQISWFHTPTESAFLIKSGGHYLHLPGGVPSFKIDENGELPAPIAAMAQAGRATIRSTGKHYRIESTEKVFLDLPGMRIVVRLSQPLKPVPVQMNPDVVAAEPPIPPAPIIRPPDTRYADPYPATEVRLLAAVKIWGAIHYFFAYKDLMDEDWDDVFAAYIPKFIEARGATEYNLVIADLMTHLADSNTAPHSKTLDAYFGEASVGLRIRLLDKYPIVTGVFDPAAVQAGVHPGDVVKRIGEESITDRFHHYVQYVPASTQQRSGYDTIRRIANGALGTEVALTIETLRGDSHVVKLTRKNNLPEAQRDTPAVRILPGNIGYLDLDRLSPDEAANAMARVKDTSALVLDLRGGAPAATVIASHLTSQGNTAVSLVTTPMALHPDIAAHGIATQTASTFVVRTLPPPAAPFYKGKTVALIDERTIGESEYAGLLFEAANKTQFVGMPSAGAESRLAELPLPGGVLISYSTEDIRHGNGGKLQRLGIQPNILTPTTAKGLRAGKDEALDAALTLVGPASKPQLAFYTQAKP